MSASWVLGGGVGAAGVRLYLALSSLREHIAGPTARLLGRFDADDVQTTVRTLQAITERAAADLAAAT